MDSELLLVIEMLKNETHPYVVVTVTDEGLRLRAESKAACELMAETIGNCRVLTREECITTLEVVAVMDMEDEIEN